MAIEPQGKWNGGIPEDADLGDILSSALEDGMEYAAAQKDFIKLQVSEQAGKVVGNLAGALITVASAVLTVLFASVALAFWLGGLMQSVASGFLVVAGGYLLLLVVFLLFAGKALTRSITLKVINSLYNGQG